MAEEGLGMWLCPLKPRMWTNGSGLGSPEFKAGRIDLNTATYSAKQVNPTETPKPLKP